MSMLLGVLISCDENSQRADSNTNVEHDTEIETSLNTDSGISSDLNTDNDTNINVELCEKYGNKVYFAFEEKETDYYVNVNEKKTNVELPDGEILESDQEQKELPIEFPHGEKSYFKIIQTYEELLTYISNPNIDASAFENNYIICIKELHYGNNGWDEEYKLAGYYNFELKNGKYEISKDFYYSATWKEHLDTCEPYKTINYFTISKSEVDFDGSIFEIVVNENQVNGYNGMGSVEIGNLYPPATNTHGYVKGDRDISNPTAWVVKKGSSLEERLGLEYNDRYLELEYRVILYLPNEPSCDFIITEKQIKNGNLYLTVEEYSQYENEYLDENDVKFYDLYIQDTSELADNFDVYVLVKTIK